MKTKTLILGVVIAVISALTVNHAKAQDAQLPAVKIITTDDSEVVKVIYGYDSREPVTVRFRSNDGVFFQDRVQGENLLNGFSKKYKLRPTPGDDIWVDVSSTELSVTFRLTVSGGKWTTQIETTTYNYPVVARR